MKLIFLGFDIAGITNLDERKRIRKEKLADLYVAYEGQEFWNIEKVLGKNNVFEYFKGRRYITSSSFLT